jgi:cell division protein FtsX
MSSKSRRLHQVSWLVMIPMQALVVIATMFIMSSSGQDFDERLTNLFATTPGVLFTIPLVVLLGYFQAWFVMRALDRVSRTHGPRHGAKE